MNSSSLVKPEGWSPMKKGCSMYRVNDEVQKGVYSRKRIKEVTDVTNFTIG